LSAINRFFGTSLLPSDFDLILPAHLAQAIPCRLPTPLSLAKNSYLLSVARRLGGQYDAIVTADNESDFGRCGIQCIHFPKFDPVRPSVDLRWYNRSAIVADLYRRFATRLTGFSMERTRRNLSVVNSDFMDARVRALHGVETVTLYPPIAVSLPAMPWERREDGFVFIGRISPEKRIEPASYQGLETMVWRRTCTSSERPTTMPM
jgi:hypothetical protein